MEDEIKFRSVFLNESDNSFAHFKYWGIDTPEKGINTWVSFANNCHIKRHEPFINIYDSEGSEIYIGDIIYNPNWWWGAGEIFLSKGQVGPCKGDNVMDYKCRGKNNHVSCNLWNGKEVTVIGNIWESPQMIGKCRPQSDAEKEFWKPLNDKMDKILRKHLR